VSWIEKFKQFGAIYDLVTNFTTASRRWNKKTKTKHIAREKSAD
jgi:hypothetical protein